MLLRPRATCHAGSLSPQGAGGSVAEAATARFQPGSAMQVQAKDERHSLSSLHGGKVTEEEKASTYPAGGDETDEVRNHPARVLGTCLSFFREEAYMPQPSSSSRFFQLFKMRSPSS